MIRVAFGSVPKDGGTFTFYRNMRPLLKAHGVDLRCVSVGRRQADLTEAAFLDDGCVQLAPETDDIKKQAQAFADWCTQNVVDIAIGVNSPGILSALPHLPTNIRAIARCANGFDEGYRLTLVGRERLMRVVALTPRLRDDLIEHYSIDPAQIVLIPNGVSPVRFAGAASKARGNNAQIELGFLGRLEHAQKGVMHLPGILQELDSSGVPYRLRIAGKGRHEPMLRAALREQLVGGRAEFIGALGPDEVPSFLTETDVFLFTSHFEGCPNALLEAMISGAVPVSWRLHGTTDFLLEDGRTGFLAKTGDVKGFASKIAQLASDKKLLQEASVACVASAKKRFSVETCAEAYTALFEAAMSEAPPNHRPRPWSQFNVDPLFKPRPLNRLIPAKQRKQIRNLMDRFRGGVSPVPDLVSGKRSHFIASHPAARGYRVHQIINSAGLEAGGAERLARQLHTRLRSEGLDARLVALEESDVSDLDAAISFGLASPYDPRALFKLGAYARCIAPEDIVHVHLFPASAYAATLSRAGRIQAQMVFTEHNTLNRRRVHPLGKVIDNQIYRAFQKVVAISNGVEAELLSARPTLRDRAMVITNGCQPLRRTPTKRHGSAAPTIVSVGRLVEQKNYDAALEAISQLRQCPIRFLIAGDGPLRAHLEHRVSELGLDEIVTLAGHVSDIPQFLADADIFLIPSLWEGFGLAAVEAMNASLPVVAADVPGLREVVGSPEQAALLVDPTSADAIASALLRLIDDPSLQVSMGRAGFRRSQRFGVDEFVASHIRLYDSLRKSIAHAA